jgi:hypothetical protein
MEEDSPRAHMRWDMAAGKMAGDGKQQWPQSEWCRARGLVAQALRVGLAQFKLFPNKFQTLPNFEIQNRRFSCFRNNQICMIQDLNILNNFLHWPNFKFPTEIMF